MDFCDDCAMLSDNFRYFELPAERGGSGGAHINDFS